MSEAMSPYCSARDEWLIMKRCMYVGYHDPNNVHYSKNMHSAGYHDTMIGRTYFDGDQVTQLNLVLYNTIKWPYPPKHSPSSEM